MTLGATGFGSLRNIRRQGTGARSLTEQTALGEPASSEPTATGTATETAAESERAAAQAFIFGLATQVLTGGQQFAAGNIDRFAGTTGDSTVLGGQPRTSRRRSAPGVA